MLILTRKIDQTIVIGGNIIVSVDGFEENETIVGVTAPDDVTIIPEELSAENRPQAPLTKVEGKVVLPRKLYEAVLIGRDIIVTILEKKTIGQG